MAHGATFSTLLYQAEEAMRTFEAKYTQALRELADARDALKAERKRCTDICLSIAERSRNSLFRSGPKSVQ